MALLQTTKPLNVPQAIQQAFDFHRQGKLPEAEKLYSDILSVRPDYFEALHMLGLLKLQSGDPASALRLMLVALAARPRSPEVLMNYSLVLDALGRCNEALATLDQLLSIKRRSVEAHNNRGALLERLGRDAEAIEAFDRVLEIKPGHADALYNRGTVLRKMRRNAEALKDFDRLLTIKPDYFKAHNNRGLVLDGLDRLEDALTAYNRALAIAPDFIEALNNRGNVLQKLGLHQDAVTCYERALAIRPDFPEALNNLGRSLGFLGRHQEALASTSRAVALKPSYIDAQWNEGLLLLRLADFDRGWKQYEWRFKRGEGLKKLRTFSKPLWLGESSVTGKTILVHFEQGLGDTIQMARYVRLLAQQGARVILEVQPPLKSLLAQLASPSIQVNGFGDTVPEFDVYCPLMSLPLAFRTELASIPPATPYLTVPPDHIARWDERMPKRTGLRVGLVWSGNADHGDDHNRSVVLARVAPLFDVPNVQFISLQKELRAADAQLLAQDPRVVDLGRGFGDFHDTAAAIVALDLVISVDTSVAHLAGALGKPVWVLLPFCPDWRWLLDRDDSPWYPTARLFRQPAMRDWESIIGQVRQELIQFASRASKNSTNLDQ